MTNSAAIEYREKIKALVDKLSSERDLRYLYELIADMYQYEA